MEINKKILELIKSCKTKEEVVEVLKKNNIKLSESDLKKVCGGAELGGETKGIEAGSNDIYKKIFTNGQ